MKIQVTEDINGMKYVRMSDENERQKTQADEDTLKEYMNSMARLYTNVSQRKESE